VVSIQTFLFTYHDEEPHGKDGGIDPDSMKKWVGTLIFFSIEDGVITIYMEGSKHPLIIDVDVRHYEVFTIGTAKKQQLTTENNHH
jgi:hypothetical protein